MRELNEEFIGIGEVRGFSFRQLDKNDYCYLYEVVSPFSEKKHYEVFFRRENTQYGNVSYPSSKAFGLWAWTYSSKDAALASFKDKTSIAISKASRKMQNEPSMQRFS